MGTENRKRLSNSRLLGTIIVFSTVLTLFSAFPSTALAQGHFEFNFHYGRWSMNLLRPIIEDILSDALEGQVKKNFLEDIQAEHPELIEQSYSQKVSFDSNGDNYGFEIRWYPGGEKGSFSLGLAVEKTSMKVALPEVSGALSLADTISGQAADFSGKVSGEFLIKPLSFHLSFRWDIFPSSPVHPFITFGVGASGGSALEESNLSYSYQGSLRIPGEAEETFTGGASKTLKQLRDEREAEGESFPLPGFFPFLQLNLGLKGKLSRNLHVLLEAGIWDGFLLRGGVSLRL